MLTHSWKKRSPIDIKAAWQVQTLVQDSSWQYTLDAADHAALSDALQDYKDKITSGECSALSAPCAEMFKIPALQKKLLTAQAQLEDAYGVVLFKNFPLNYNQQDLALLYSGFLAHIGTMQPQTVEGETVQSVQDENQARLYERRGSKHNLGLPVHNDGCDVVGFLCTRTPQQGGTTILVSAAAVHNALLEKCPDVLDILYQPFHHAWQDYMFPSGRNVASASLPQTWSSPIFSQFDGKLCCRYSRFYTNRAQSFPAVPKMTEAQIHALDTLDSYLYDQENWQFRRQFAPGDVLLLNNHVLLHSRTEYIDGAMPAQRRHLFRAWMSLPNSRPLAASMAEFFGNIEAGAVRRGGVKNEFLLKPKK